LESLSRSSPEAVVLFWVPIAAVALLMGLRGGIGVWTLVGGTAYAVLAWTLFEYAVHRFAFHAPLKGTLGERITFIIHGCHHVEPRDSTRNVTPVVGAIPTGLLLYGTNYLMFPLAQGFWISGIFILSYVFYDVMHWRLHQGLGVTRAERFLRRHHMLHHFSGNTVNYGVSSPLWDILFRSFTTRGGMGPKPEHVSAPHV
jgi:sterol desaturase/sphingolipid hydroxylase (fatty acid hydroxylase superfamily)